MPTEELVVMGWGRRNNDPGDRGNLSTTGVFSNIMQQLVVPEVPLAKCKEFTSFGALDVEKEICAGGETGERFTSQIFPVYFYYFDLLCHFNLSQSQLFTLIFFCCYIGRPI